jgi:hypothetical protein
MDDSQMLCPQCHEPVKAGNNFCIKCGHPFAIDSQQEGQATGQASPAHGLETPAEEQPKPSSINLEEDGVQIKFRSERGERSFSIHDQSNNQGIIAEQGGVAVQTDEVNFKDLKSNVTILAPNLKELPKAKHEPEQWSVVSLEGIQLQKLKTVFVRPKKYPTIIAQLEKQTRILVVQGKLRTGRTICAVNIGLDLEQGEPEPRIFIYQRYIQEKHSLIDFIQSREQPTSGVYTYIVEDALETGVSEAELTGINLQRINEILEKKNSYVILTISKELECTEVPLLATEVDKKELPTVFSQHLNWYKQAPNTQISEDLVTQLAGSRGELCSILGTPYQVDLFFKRLIFRENIPARIEDQYKKNTGQFKYFSEMDEASRNSLTLEIFKQISQEVVKSSFTSVGSMRNWFNSLSENARLYAMFVSLFQNVNWFTLDSLYILAVTKLRETGIHVLCDPREIGRSDLLEMIHVEQKENDLLRFENLAYQAEAEWQVNNRHHLLWSLINVWGELIQQFKGPDFWELRRSFGVAIGRLGVDYPDKLRVILTELADHEHGGVVAVAGFALDELCRRGPENYRFVQELLEEWVDSGDPDRMWAVGASIERLYATVAKSAAADPLNRADEMRKTLWTVMRELAEHFDRFSNKASEYALELLVEREVISQADLAQLKKNKILSRRIARLVEEQLADWAVANQGAVIHALRWMALGQASDVAKELTQWLNYEKSIKLAGFGLLFGYLAFDDSSDENIELIEERYLPLLALVEPLIITASYVEELTFDLIDCIVHALARWISKAGWGAAVYATLVKVANRLPGLASFHFRQCLAENFLQSEHAELQRLGQALMVRCQVIQGAPVGLRGSEYGLLTYSSTRLARINDSNATAHKMLGMARACLDTLSFPLGTHNILPADAPASLNALSTERNVPAILMPGLEKVVASKHCPPSYLMVLGWEPVLDADDLPQELIEKRLILALPRPVDKELTEKPLFNASTGPPSQEALERHSVYIQLDYSDANCQEIEVRLHDTLAVKWVAADPQVLEARLASVIEVSIENVKGWLNEWAAGLEADTSIAFEAQGRIASCAAGWLLKVDPTAAVSLVQEWLSCETNTAQYLAGKALTRLFFHLQAGYAAAPALAATSSLLELVDPFIKVSGGWEDIRLLLDFFKRCLPDPDWARRLLPSQIFSLIAGHTPKTALNDLHDYIASWKESKIETLHQAAERIEARISIGEHTNFPELPEGSKYVLILLDASLRRTVDLAEIVHYLMEKFSQQANLVRQFTPVVCRLGQRQPLPLIDQTLLVSDIVPHDLPYLPVLSVPILEKITTGQTALLLFFTNSALIDWEDWNETWRNKQIWAYISNAHPGILPNEFVVLNTSARLPSEPQAIANNIFDLIRTRLKG